MCNIYLITSIGGIQMIKNKKAISRLVTMITLLILGTLGVKAVEINHIVKELDKQIAETQKEVEENKMKIEDLKKERESMDTPEYIEKVAREKLGMVKADDIVFKEK